MYKNKNIVREGPFFTHFAAIPFLKAEQRQHVLQIQKFIRQQLKEHPKYQDQCLKEHSHNLSHVTLFKLVLRRSDTRQALRNLLQQMQPQISSVLSKLQIGLNKIGYFTRYNKNEKMKEVTVIYMELNQQTVNALNALVDQLMRRLLQTQIIASHELKDMNVVYDHRNNQYRPETPHISLFRARQLLDDEHFQQKFEEIQNKIEKKAFLCYSLDISTMGQFGEDQFYLPLLRLPFQTQQKSNVSISE